MGFTMDEAYPSQVTKSKTPWLIFDSQSGQTVGSKFSTKKGDHKMTNVKKTIPRTFVAFCSSRIILPCRAELRDMTLEFLEWCDLIVVERCKMHGDDVFFFDSSASISSLFVIFLLDIELSFRSVAERRNGEDLSGFDFDWEGTRVVRTLPLVLESRFL